ncbi:MAG: AMP-binding protein [Massilia sp.]
MDNIFARTPWWRAAGVLDRFIASLAEAELGRLRPGRPPGMVSVDADLAADLGADSLELMAFTATLSEVLQLPQAAMLDGLLTDTHLASWTAITATALEAARPQALCFRTSGSAGAPKSCLHRLDSLWQEVAALATLFPGRRRVVSFVPAHHIYGFLFTVLLPQALGGVEVVAGRGRVAAGVWQSLQAGDLVIGFPEVWQAALAGAGGLADDVVGVSSTAPCPDPLATALTQAGLARLVQVYGSSESAGVGWRESAAAPYRCFPYWQRAPADAPVLERAMPDGSRQVFRLQDRLSWQDDAHFLPAGRIDEAVQVGGVNVFPERVAEILRRHPQVVDVAVRLMRPDEGARLKAFIAVATEAASEHLLTGQLEALAREHLQAAERPAAYTFGAALPRQRNGKLADWLIDLA